MLSRNNDSGHPCLTSDFKKNISNVSLLSVKFAVDFWQIIFGKNFHLIPDLP